MSQNVAPVSQMNSVSEHLFREVGPARDGSEIRAALEAAARERILILDGAMGTQIQGLGFDEEQFRGEAFAGCACHQQGNNDLLILSQPQAIEEIHYQYAIAGADIIETNTFSSTSIAQADYGMEDAVYALNRDGARLVRRACIRAEQEEASAVSSPARWGQPTAPPRCRPMSTIPDAALFPLTISASPMASSCAA
jgi:5-methyltetrahydrofolate--homocysteine methyltransferase